MAGPFYYRHYIGDYDTATKDFSLLQHGVYRRLLDGYFSLGGLPSDEFKLFRITGALMPEEQVAVRYVVDLQFEVDGDRLVNERCDKELERIARESSVQSDKARKRWGTKAETAPVDPPAPPAAPPPAPAPAHAQRMPVKSQDSSSKQEQKQKPRGKDTELPDPATFVFPAWVPRVEFDKYVAQRKKAPSYHALELLVKKLGDLDGRGHPAKLVLEQSIMQGWLGIFELKNGPVAKDGIVGKGGRRQAVEERNEAMADRWALEDLTSD